MSRLASTPVTFGLIGYGKIGERHAEHIVAHPEGRLAGICDVKPDRLKVGVKHFPGIRLYDNLEEMTADPAIDIISICTPNFLHADMAIAALKGGKHVLVEKPMAIRKSDAEQMIQAALKTGKSLFVVKQNRFNPPVQAVKQLMLAGKLGRIYSVSVNCYWNRGDQYYASSDWKGQKEKDGGTLFTQFSHFIDIIYYLFGDMEIMEARMHNAGHQGVIDFEDTGIITFQLTDHKATGVMHYTTTAYGKNMEASITVFAEHGTVKIGGQYLNRIDYQSIRDHEISLPDDPTKPNQYGDYEGSMSNHDKVIDNVIQSLHGKSEIMTNTYDGLKTVEIIEQAYRKASIHG